MNWNIPTTSGKQPLQITLEAGDRLFMVGANGSGKSALIQHLVSLPGDGKVRRITAHRQTAFDSKRVNFTYPDPEHFEQQIKSFDRQSDARWKEDNHGREKQLATFSNLIDKEDFQARSVRDLVRNNDIPKAVKASSESDSPFGQINELFQIGNLAVSLKLSNAREILARRRDEGTDFNITQMSDGERSAAIMAATVLTVEPGTILLIDEPERHLHRAIIEPFLSALFEQRKDCAFVISTHEIALPVANPDARVLMIRSCTWEGATAKAWDVEILEPNTELPEELKLVILGARERILFVEGASSSLDRTLYKTLFPGLSVVPKGNCIDVERAVSGLRGSCDLNHVKAFGLIDRDDRPEEKILELADKGVFALDVCSVESLYYCSDAIAAVAHRQAESQGSNGDKLIELARTEALSVLRKQPKLAERMAARRCERTVHNSMLSQLPHWKKLIDTNASSKICACVNSPYHDELERFRKLVADGKLDKLVARYPLDTSVFDAIAKALRCPKRKDYERMVVSRIRKDGGLSQKLKERISALSSALGAHGRISHAKPTPL